MLRTGILWITLAAVALPAMAEEAAAAAKKTAQKKKTEAPPAANTPNAVLANLPAGAKSIGPNEWSYTDPQGKKWIYRRTPFTLAKIAADDDPANNYDSSSYRDMIASTTAVEDGANIRFSRPGPFGNQLSWTKAKNDLDEFERRVWEREQKKAAARARSASPAPSNTQE
jgi:hypothetical protein